MQGEPFCPATNGRSARSGLSPHRVAVLASQLCQIFDHYTNVNVDLLTNDAPRAFDEPAISWIASFAQQAHLVVPDASPDGFTDTNFGMSLKVIGDLLLVGAYDDVNAEGVQTGKAYVYTRGGSTWTEHPDLEMAPGDNGFPGPQEDRERFANFVAMTKLGSQTLFVMSAHTFSDPSIDSANLSNTLHVGGVYTATLH